jgi:hypothetical protein
MAVLGTAIARAPSVFNLPIYILYNMRIKRLNYKTLNRRITPLNPLKGTFNSKEKVPFRGFRGSFRQPPGGPALIGLVIPRDRKVE